jgi:uncharacterized membrane-anchored protein
LASWRHAALIQIRFTRVSVRWRCQSARKEAMNSNTLSKVPAITLVFWIVKILCTTIGETGGDALSMSMGLGYLLSTAIFATIFIGMVIAQASARNFHPILYWATIVATTTVGTTLADFADRTLGIGYPGGVAVLIVLLAASLLLWHRTLGTVAVESVGSPTAEAFYWTTIMFSQTLGTALGDWAADSMELGYGGAALVFGAALAVVAAAYFWTRISHVLLFWAAFILTRPLGAVVGDFLDKPVADGGLNLSRYTATAALLVLIAFCVLVLPHRAARRAPGPQR